MSSDHEDEVDLDTRLRAIKQELEEVNTELSRLNQRRRKLEHLEEKLRIQKLQLKSNELAQKDWNSQQFPWSSQVRAVLKDVFNIKDFRAQQLGTINAVLSKKDVLLLAPTGGGKSLCYQLPALVVDGITLIVSPLISLMEDQVWALKKLGIRAEYLCSNTDKETVNIILKQLREGDCSNLKLLYITPERVAKSNRFMAALQKCYNAKKLTMVSIDEVHCCSQWGHDYRPDYKHLSVIKTMFPDVPLLGVTATATAKVIADVRKMLNLRECLIFNAPFNRPNLYYHVLEKQADKTELHDMLADLIKRKYRHMSGIIYTFSVKDTEELSTQLLQRDVKVLPYYGNLDPKQRSRAHQKWMRNEIQVIVATNAFGMGIDKPDVRFVIHHTMSKSMENFYQESGRAGRDGKRSDCILLYQFKDIFRLSSMIFSEYEGLDNVYSMVKYCINGKDCRRKLISRHFAEVWDDSHCDRLCDHCYYRDKVRLPEQDVTNYYHTLVAILRRAETLQTKLTPLKLVDAWYHKGSPKNRLEEPPPLLDRYIGEQLVAFLIVNGYLKEDFQYNQYTTLCYIAKGSAYVGTDGIRFQAARVLRIPVDSLKSPPKAGSSCISDAELEVIPVTSSISSVAESPIRTSTSKRKMSEINGSDRDECFSIGSETSLSSENSIRSVKIGRKSLEKRRETISSECDSTEQNVTKVAKLVNRSISKKTPSKELIAAEPTDDEDVLFVPNQVEVIDIDEL
ncbi:ATP-dependent DNA helicase Q1-like [Topomyia yanbarensis]|uniref:ATP-dependent DNA helicase Q1-like n=1 Tax=Topomyia yanbarensis TaxID=2498891 RepID=UPI00273C985D|nr:ATP-dependent DNA helicase Q1-like [Topomyia yanbarensis]